jgi:hypothetical protein
MRTPRALLSDWFLRQLTRRRRRYRRYADNDAALLKAAIQPGDVLLVDGDQHVSQAIKYLTMSPWSHSALYVGDALLRRDPTLRRSMQRKFGREARHLIIEALVERGVVVSPLVKYLHLNLRICRPTGLTSEDRETVLDYAISRIGWRYDRRNLFDLTRYLLPFHLVPSRLREDALHFGSGRETETICSSLLAEAFGQVGFPILPGRPRRRPTTVGERVRQQLLGRPTRYAYSGFLRARHPTLCVPRDFDLSPYFEVIKWDARQKPGFDYRKLEWEGARQGSES